MWDVVPSIEKHKFNMIEYLFSESMPVTIQELSEVLMISRRSVGYYLSDLKKICKDLDGELITSTEGISLKLPVNIGLDYFQRAVFKNTESFQLLEKLFFEDVVSKKEMADYLYISPSTLNRLLKNLNTTLDYFGLSIHTSPLYITGEELMIRTFYISYFQEAYSVTEWPFHNIDERTFKKLIEKLSGSFRFEENSFNIIEYRNIIAVCTVRALHNHLLVGGSKYSCEDIEWLKNTVSSLNLPEKVRQNCYNELLSMHHFFADIFTDNQMNSALRYNDEVRNIAEVNDIAEIINTLSEQFNLPDDVRPSKFDIYRINLKISYYGKGLSTCKSINYLLFKPREYKLVTIYEHHYSPFYNALYQLLVELFDKRKLYFGEDMIKDILSSFILTWSNLTKNLFYQFNSCRLLVYNHSTDSIALSFSEELKSTLRRFIEVDTIPGREISERKLLQHDFDVLISSTTLQLNIKQPIFYLHRLPDFSLRLAELEQLIDTILQKKRNRLLPHK
ncbi:helix-turn-helix domain-containing protein [Corticicoccus populi]|uniref:Helix-turn-helix domain-containing protein n=1 Tax=Corticicoccus populi TaxID=1812821 RepID=A0ABW5WW69_9STAP